MSSFLSGVVHGTTWCSPSLDNDALHSTRHVDIHFPPAQTVQTHSVRLSVTDKLLPTLAARPAYACVHSTCMHPRSPLRSLDWGDGFIGTQTHLPPKVSFSPDFVHFILKMLENETIRVKKKVSEMYSFFGGGRPPLVSRPEGRVPRPPAFGGHVCTQSTTVAAERTVVDTLSTSP